MTLVDEANKLRMEIVRLGAAHGRRYPTGMKALIVGWFDRAKQEGMAMGDACRQIGVSSRQLSAWRTELRAAQTKALVPVTIVEASAPTAPIAFVTPRGYRIEGITLAQAIELVGAFE